MNKEILTAEKVRDIAALLRKLPPPQNMVKIKGKWFLVLPVPHEMVKIWEKHKGKHE